MHDFANNVGDLSRLGVGEFAFSLGLPQPRSSRIAAAAMRARAGALGSIMIPASVLMAVSVYDRASDSMCPRFFAIFRSFSVEGGLRVGRAFIES